MNMSREVVVVFAREGSNGKLQYSHVSFIFYANMAHFLFYFAKYGPRQSEARCPMTCGAISLLLQINVSVGGCLLPCHPAAQPIVCISLNCGSASWCFCHGYANGICYRGSIGATHRGGCCAALLVQPTEFPHIASTCHFPVAIAIIIFLLYKGVEPGIRGRSFSFFLCCVTRHIEPSPAATLTFLFFFSTLCVSRRGDRRAHSRSTIHRCPVIFHSGFLFIKETIY